MLLSIFGDGLIISSCVLESNVINLMPKIGRRATYSAANFQVFKTSEF